MNLLILLSLLAVDFETLSANAGVAKVEQILPGEPSIVHIANWHWTPKAAFAEAEGLEGEDLDREYAKAMASADAVQRSVKMIISDAPTVYVEGLTDQNKSIVAVELKALRSVHRDLQTLDSADSDAAILIAEHRVRLLRLGAAAELQLDGRPIKLLPAEGAEHEAARPKDGVIDEKLQAVREAAIVKRITKRGKTALLLLGGGHDLREFVKQHEGWGYVRVTPKGMPAQ